MATLSAVSPDSSERDRSAIRWRRALLAGLLPIAAWSCSRESAESRFENAPVVLISIDTLRSDRLPIYGYERGSTPAIDALRRDGLLAARAYTPRSAHVARSCVALHRAAAARSRRARQPRLSARGPICRAWRELLAGRRLRHRRRGVGRDPAARRAESRTASRYGTSRVRTGLAAAQAERAGPATLAAILPWLRSVRERPVLPVPPSLRAARSPSAAGSVRLAVRNRRTTARWPPPTRRWASWWPSCAGSTPTIARSSCCSRITAKVWAITASRSTECSSIARRCRCRCDQAAGLSTRRHDDRGSGAARRRRCPPCSA